VHYFYIRQYERAIAEFRKVIEMDPDFYVTHFLLGRVYVHSGNHEAGIQALETALHLTDGSDQVRTLVAWGYAVAGDADRAREMVEALGGRGARTAASPYYMTFVSTALGEIDQAFAWLEEAYEQRDPRLLFLSIDPELDPLRSDPRFKNMLDRIGLPTD
jgi:tetratricopeptide (TPR) repeat protein